MLLFPTALVRPSLRLSVRVHILRDRLMDFLDNWYQGHYWWVHDARFFKFRKKLKMALSAAIFPVILMFFTYYS